MCKPTFGQRRRNRKSCCSVMMLFDDENILFNLIENSSLLGWSLSVKNMKNVWNDEKMIKTILI